MDESSKQLIKETRQPIPMKPGDVEKFDTEYERNGTASIFMAFEPLQGLRFTKITEENQSRLGLLYKGNSRQRTV